MDDTHSRSLMEKVAFFMILKVKSFWTLLQASLLVVSVRINCSDNPCSWYSTGHSHPKLTAAITNQMNRIHHCSNLYYIPQQAALAEWLVKNSCADKAFFCNSGAEANEAAIKLARKYAHTKLGIRFPVILTAKNSFHGRTLATVTATAQPKYQKDFEPLMPGFEYVEYNDIEELKSTVERIRKDESKGLAAIMMEPLQGEGGVRPGDASFFRTVRQLCDDTGALMIVDEVQTGMGRTGKLWGYENLGIEPDVITNAKALGGGVPIGVMLCKEKFNVFQPGDHASTYGGNPLACSAGLAVTEVFDDEKIVSQVARKGEEFRQLAVELLQKKFPKIVKEVRGWGLINGIQLFEESKLTAADITKELLQAGKRYY